MLTRRREHADALNRDGLRVTGRADRHARRHGLRRPGRARALRPGDHRHQGNGARGRCSRDRRSLRRGDDDDRPQRARCRGGRPLARRLADRLGRDVHVRDPPRGHRGRVHPRHRDLARPLRGHSAGDRGRDRRPDRPLGSEGSRVRRSSTRAVVEADLQRDGELGRGADRAPTRPALRSRGPSRPTSVTSSTISSTRARRSRRRPGSSSTTIRGR